MSRASTFLIVTAMVVTAASIAVVLNLQFGFPLGQSAALGLALLFGLALLHVQSQRKKDRRWLEARIAEISAVAGDVNTEVDAIASRLGRLENGLPDRIREENENLAVEVEVVGKLMKQVADALADVENRLERRIDEVAVKAEANRLAPPPRFEAQATLAPPQPYVAPIPTMMPSVPYPAAATPPAAQTIPVAHAPQPAPMQPHLQQPQDRARPAAAAAPPMAPPAPDQHAYDPYQQRIEPRFDVAPGQADPHRPAAAQPPAPQGASPVPGVPRPVQPEPARIPTPFEREVETAVRTERIEIHLQPVVTLPQRKVRYYEVLSRLRGADNRLLTGAEFIEAAEFRRVMPKLDTFQVIRAFQVLKRLTTRNREIGLFVNLSVSSLVDPTFFREFHTFLNQNRSVADLVQFEFSQATVRDMGPLELESLGTLSDLGYRFSIDRVEDLKMDLQLLFKTGFRTIKIAADRVLGHAPLPGIDIHPADLAGHFSRNGFSLIADKVETEAQVVVLLDYDIRFGQGNLFSAPRQVRPEILGIPAAGSPPATPQQQPAASGAAGLAAKPPLRAQR